MDDHVYSTSESGSYSPSLPSLSFNFDQALKQEAGRVLTVKEHDSKLNELQRENLNLKLRLYFLEKEKGKSLNGGSVASSVGITHYNRVLENDSLAKELNKKENALRKFQHMLDEKDIEIELLRSDLEAIAKENEAKIFSLNQEKNIILRELQDLKKKSALDLSGENLKVVQDLEQKLYLSQNELANLRRELTFSCNENHLKTKQITDLQLKIKQLNEEILHSKKTISPFDSTIHTYKFMLDEKEIELETLRAEMDTIKNSQSDLLATYKQMLAQTRNELDLVRIERNNAQISEKDKLITYTQKLDTKECELELCKEQKIALETRLENEETEQLLRNKLKITEQELDQLKQEKKLHNIERRDGMLQTYREMLEVKDDEIERLQKMVDHLEEEDTKQLQIVHQEEKIKKLTTEFELQLRDKQDIIDQSIRERERILIELNTYKAKKDNIEKAITRQLKKTDKLLKKAKINLIET